MSVGARSAAFDTAGGCLRIISHSTEPDRDFRMAANSRPSVERAGDKEKALEAALVQIERQFGKGSVMRLGEETHVPVEVIPTGSISLDVALGIGGCRAAASSRYTDLRAPARPPSRCTRWRTRRRPGGIAAFIDAEHALDPEYAQKLGVDTEALLVSQPDTGEQALEIMDMLIRSGAIDIVVVDSVAALVPKAEIEGDMGDSHVGLQARLMSQALRKITGAINTTKTTAIFINQLREKVGVMFGCMSIWHASHPRRRHAGEDRQDRQPADGRRGPLLRRRRPTAWSPRKIVNWFNNGNAERFLQFTVAKSGKNGRAQFAATENHLIRTPGGWRQAGELIAGDRVLVAESTSSATSRSRSILGSLMGDGNLSPNRRDRSGPRFRMGHGAKQAAYLDWKVSLLGNILHSRTSTPRVRSSPTSPRSRSWASCTMPSISVTARSTSPGSTSRA